MTFSWFGNAGGALKGCCQAIWRNEVYDEDFTNHAEGVKAAIQILIGFTFAGFLIYQFISDSGKLSLEGSINHSLRVIGGALAVSAVVELVYTFFTRGPDEATDPLILGISSFAIVKLSDSKAQLNTATALPVSLLALAIVALFFARRYLSGAGKKETATSQEKDTVGKPDPLMPPSDPPRIGNPGKQG